MNLRAPVELNITAILSRIKEAEDYYKTLPRVEFRRSANSPKIKLKSDNTTESFVRKFFSKFNWEYKTYFSDTVVKAVNTELYCDINTRRSIEDIYRTSYCYLGDKLTLKDLIIEVYNTVMAKSAGSNYCRQINKRVYKDREAKNGCYYDETQYDELGLQRAHYQLLIKSSK